MHILNDTIQFISQKLAESSLPPFTTQEGLIFYGVNAFILLIVLEALRMLFVLLLNKRLSIKSTPFSAIDRTGKKILLVGDSTAVGTGAERVEDTIAARLAKDFPNTQVVNLGENGTRVRDMLRQVKKVSEETFDMVIICTGGNDIWHFSNIKRLGRDLAEAFDIASKISNHRVIFLLYSNIGLAPVFPSFLRFFLVKRGNAVHQKFIETANIKRVPVIQLFTSEEDNPFLKDPKLMFARDGIHPSSEGYRAWYNRMWLTMVKDGYLFLEGDGGGGRKIWKN